VPTGLDSFECTPWLPKAWPRMALRDVRAFDRAWNLLVERVGDQQKVTVSSGGKTVMTGSGPAGKTYSVTFPNRKPPAPGTATRQPEGRPEIKFPIRDLRARCLQLEEAPRRSGAEASSVRFAGQERIM
jgi:hypothetical protein